MRLLITLKLMLRQQPHDIVPWNQYYNKCKVQQVRLIYPGEDDHLVVERTSGKENAYLILSHNFHTQDYFKSRFDSLYRLEDEIQFIGVTIYKYRVNDDPDQ